MRESIFTCRFKVSYYSKDPDKGVENLVGEGQILFIVPRHPNKGVHTEEHVTWKETLHDINVDLEAGLWGTGPELDADEVDRLTFCCCEACQSPLSLSLGLLLWFVSISQFCQSVLHTCHVLCLSPRRLSSSHRRWSSRVSFGVKPATPLSGNSHIQMKGRIVVTFGV